MSRSTISTFKIFEMFPDAETARLYLESRLWPNGPACPVCNAGERIGTRKTGFYRCYACNEDFTVRTGTIFERSHIPLQVWLHALYLISQNSEVPSEALGEQLGVTQKSAWLILKRVHEAAGDLLALNLTIGDQSRILTDWPAYRVDADGSIWTRYRRGKGGRLGFAWRILNPTVDRDGYRVVRLYGERGAWKQLRVARLVCAAFHGPCPTGLQVRHLDGNSMNDAESNLQWGTTLDNHIDMETHGTRPLGQRHHNAKLSDGQIAEIRALKGKMLQREVAAQFGTTQGYVSELWGSRAYKRRLTYKRLVAR